MPGWMPGVGEGAALRGLPSRGRRAAPAGVAAIAEAAPAVPFAPLARTAATLREPLLAAVERVLERGAYHLGEELRAFEEEFARFAGARHAVGVGSGHDAIVFALKAAGIRPGDEVVVPAMTAFPTVAAVAAAGAVPVAVDVDEAGLLDVPRVEEALTPRTRAVVPVHLCGAMADVAGLRELADARGLVVVEDAAHAHGARRAGARAGTASVAGAFSFYPTKNLGAFGDGGCVVTDDPEIARRVRSLRNGGREAGADEVRDVAGSSRLDELQAAVLRVQLPLVASWNERRRALAGGYARALAGRISLPSSPPDGLHVHHLFVALAPDRDGLRARLAARGVETGVHYPRAVHHQPAFAAAGGRAGPCPRAEAWARSAISLPCHPELADGEHDLVIGAVLEGLGPGSPP
ncbi:DegT/DnrJ/EryC1/StrS family aminotransferase [Myxococcota bacterium]|nr:DegT/DnrJ/EryC1/StrS family aminotransferase [Myxococcota bacterium]